MKHASPFTVLEFVCQDMYEQAAKNRAPKAMPTNRPAPASSPPSLPAPVPKAVAASPPPVAPATWRLPVPPPPEGFPVRLGLHTTVLMVDCSPYSAFGRERNGEIVIAPKPPPAVMVVQWRLVVYMCLFAGWVEHLVGWQGARATATNLASWATCRSSTWAWLPLLHDALNSSSSR